MITLSSRSDVSPPMDHVTQQDLTHYAPYEKGIEGFSGLFKARAAGPEPDPPRQADAATPATPLTAAPRPGPGCPRTPPASTRRRPARESGTSARTTNIRRPGGGPADHPGESAGQRGRPVLPDPMSTAGAVCEQASRPVSLPGRPTVLPMLNCALVAAHTYLPILNAAEADILRT